LRLIGQVGKNSHINVVVGESLRYSDMPSF
jgi:hypothetical protein